jgi:hypothetical protein
LKPFEGLSDLGTRVETHLKLSEKYMEDAEDFV